MHFDEKTRKLESDSGYIRSLDDSLYTDHAIYLGIRDLPENYEEGNAEGYLKWVEEREKPEPTAEDIATDKN